MFLVFIFVFVEDVGIVLGIEVLLFWFVGFGIFCLMFEIMLFGEEFEILMGEVLDVDVLKVGVDICLEFFELS